MKLNMLLALAGVAIAGSALANQAQPVAKADPAKAKAIVEQVCAACHGADGNSVAAANPSLAGQHPEYLQKQLTEFKSGKRANPIMMGMAATLSDDDMRNVAAYFSQQTAKTRDAVGDKAVIARGKAVYKGGIADAKVPACMACHGPAGAGIPGQYPKLGAQHAGYIETQMLAFKKKERANNPVMNDIAARMSDADIKAVASFISGLR